MWATLSRGDLRDELVAALRQEGLDARPSEDADQFVVGTTHRGDRAEPARVRIPPADGEFYLQELKAGRGGDDPDEYAFGMLVMLLVEALSTVHDGENNLVTEVELRRGLEGRLGLHETRIESGASFLPPGDPTVGPRIARAQSRVCGAQDPCAPHPALLDPAGGRPWPATAGSTFTST